MISLDTEANGLDLHHGCKPFLVTSCTDEGETTFWEWDVDPLTREPSIPPGDLREIRDLLARVAGWGKFSEDVRDRHKLVGHNSKFDAAALAAVGVDDWPWGMTEDSLIAGHLLASNQPHDLTAMVYHYLGDTIEHFERALEEAVKECRRMVQQARLRVKRLGEKELGEPEPQDAQLARWRIADEGLPEMPSARGELWRSDYWLPRAMVKWLWESSEAGRTWTEGKTKWDARTAANPNIFRCLLVKDEVRDACKTLPGWEYRPPETEAADDEGHPWWTVLSDYANADSAATVALWQVLRRKIAERGLGKIYRERMRLLPVTVGMERRGLTLDKDRLDEKVAEYTESAGEAAQLCVGIAASYDYELTLPKGSSNNKSLTSFAFDVLKLPVVLRTDTGLPSLSKDSMEVYLNTLDVRSKQYTFVRALADSRSDLKAVEYMTSYTKYWKHLDGSTHYLHPNLNPTGTNTLRWSHSNPNSANISKKTFTCRQCKGKGCGKCGGTGEVSRNIRRAFGPGPGREWWSMDYKNVELRLPAYLSGERLLIGLFEEPDAPPYYGSEHILNFSTVYPDIWEDAVREVGLDKAGPYCKKKYAATWYQWVKNGDFAIGYQAGDATADKAFHKPGARQLLLERFRNKAKLNDDTVAYANRYGYVETIPDRTIDPARGYPVMCTRTERGSISPTVPLSFKIQSSAMWLTGRAMVECGGQLDEWRRQKFDGRIVIQQHDELVFDLPKRADPRENPKGSNLGRVKILQGLMEATGTAGYNIPTPVGLEWHPVHWGEGVSVA